MQLSTVQSFGIYHAVVATSIYIESRLSRKEGDFSDTAILRVLISASDDNTARPSELRTFEITRTVDVCTYLHPRRGNRMANRLAVAERASRLHVVAHSVRLGCTDVSGWLGVPGSGWRGFNPATKNQRWESRKSLRPFQSKAKSKQPGLKRSPYFANLSS